MSKLVVLIKKIFRWIFKIEKPVEENLPNNKNTVAKSKSSAETKRKSKATGTTNGELKANSGKENKKKQQHPKRKEKTTKSGNKQDAQVEKTTPKLDTSKESNKTAVETGSKKDTGLVTGKRKKREDKKPREKIEFRGKIKYTTTRKYDQSQDIKYYPIISTPFQTAIVLKPSASGNGIQGVSEPVLLQKISDFIEKEKRQIDLQTSNNLELPIRKRNYSFEPDLSLVLDEKNLFIDIEIDEPYDGITRNPIHYQGCKDELRNIYFNQNGWVVVRFTEEQVILHTDSCVKKIAELLDSLVNTKLLQHFENIEDLVPTKQWTKEEAMLLEKRKFRESYLKKEFNGSPSEELRGEPTNSEILSEEYYQLKNKIEKVIGKRKNYLKFVYANDDFEKIIFAEKIIQKNFQFYVEGFDFFTLKQSQFKLAYITNDSIIETPFLSKETNKSKKIEKLLRNAFYGLNAVKINYTNGQGVNSTRVLSHIKFHTNKSQVFTEYNTQVICMHDEIYNNTFIDAYCHYRQEERTFRIDRINSLQILDSRFFNSFITPIISTIWNNRGWQYLMKKDLKKADNVFQRAHKYNPDDIVIIGNIAHIALLKGDSIRAIKIYKKHKGEFTNDQTKWEDMIKSDFKGFEKKGFDKELLQKVLNELFPIRMAV